MARSVFCAEGALGAAVDAATKRRSIAEELEGDMGFRRSAVPGPPAEMDPTPMEASHAESVHRDASATLVEAERAHNEALANRLAENGKLKYTRLYKSLFGEGARYGATATDWHPGRIEVALTNLCEKSVIVNILPLDGKLGKEDA